MEYDKIPIIVFDDSSKKRILESLGLKKNKQSELVDSNEQIITNQEFESIKEDEFGGILKSSKIAIKKDISELVKFFVNKVNEE